MVAAPPWLKLRVREHNHWTEDGVTQIVEVVNQDDEVVGQLPAKRVVCELRPMHLCTISIELDGCDVRIESFTVSAR